MPKTVEGLSKSGLIFKSLNTKEGTMTVYGITGDVEIWKAVDVGKENDSGRSYAVLFLGRQFEFVSSVRATPEEKEDRGSTLRRLWT